MTDRPNGITVRDAIRMTGDFRALLAELGVKLPPGSPAAKELATIETVMGWVQGKGEPPISEEYRDTLQDAVCAIQVVELALRRRSTGTSLYPFVNHFRLLESGSMRLSADADADERNHKLFELLVGLAVASFASDVRLDHPWKSKTDNPDLTATIDGRRWGFACKVPSSPNALTVHDNIMKGFAQIERADVAAGLVVLSAKNIFKSSDLLPVAEVNGRKAIGFQKPGQLKLLFGGTMDRLMDDVNRLAGAVERSPRSAPGKSVPFAFWVGTTATISRAGGPPRPTLHALAGGWRVALPDGPTTDGETRTVLDRIHGELSR